MIFYDTYYAMLSLYFIDEESCKEVSEIAEEYNSIIEMYQEEDKSNFCYILKNFKSKFEGNN